MSLKKIIFTLSLLVFTFCWTQAQIQLRASDATGEKGQVINVNIIISGFSEILGMQFSINWDTTVLAFKEVSNLTEKLPQFTDEEIGLAEVESGAIRVVWIDNSVNGVSLEDSTLLFTLKFELIGAYGTTSAIGFSGEPIAIEFIDTTGIARTDVALVEGLINILDNSTATLFLEAVNGMQLYQNDPNPFYLTTKITTHFSTAKPARFYISTIEGKVVYHTSFRATQGINTLEVERAFLKVPGIYFYTLQSGNYQLSKKMILLP